MNHEGDVVRWVGGESLNGPLKFGLGKNRAPVRFPGLDDTQVEMLVRLISCPSVYSAFTLIWRS